MTADEEFDHREFRAYADRAVGVHRLRVARAHARDRAARYTRRRDRARSRHLAASSADRPRRSGLWEAIADHWERRRISEVALDASLTGTLDRILDAPR